MAEPRALPETALQFVTVVTSSPLTVQLPTGDTVPALRVLGLVYSSGQAGLAILRPSNIPVVLPIGV